MDLKMEILKKDQTHIMIDIETMAVTANAAIVSIGAIKFNRLMLLDEFYTNVELDSCKQIGLEIDTDTVEWWAQQNEHAIAALQKNPIPIERALTKLAEFIDSDSLIWGNGADFDNVILANAYNKAGIERPWSFRNNRCYRTIKTLYPHITTEFAGTHHQALDDARNQAVNLVRINEHCTRNQCAKAA